MTSMLPPTRDLPPGRRTQIRAELERAATGRRRRLLFPVLAGAAAVATVAASVLTLQPAPPPPSPAVHVTSPQVTTTPPSTGFEVPRETVEAIEAGCMKSTGMPGKAKLHQLLEGETRWALLYTEDEMLPCALGEAGRDYSAGFGKRAVQLLPGHFSVDIVSSTAGGDHLGPERAGMPGHRTVAGRIDSAVARVTVTADGRTTDAKIANGTYALRTHYPRSWTVPANEPDPVVRAYDAAGTLLGTSSDLLTACFFDPASREIVYGDPRKRDQCQVASPWK
ncbi:hypothetical protein [Lentzea sp. NEAU-D7]|uniref:hypothetical protein n=1 Tax=Lentzea sp. NEAU-D7 TaxID=2994667 RepID=UPI00224A8A02|nr:hypothetical protein [Lentzea sp. NEAU-D7]MCX2951818.1 hypothetical protein [Lentzea sp. NEAU-D7]